MERFDGVYEVLIQQKLTELNGVFLSFLFARNGLRLSAPFYTESNAKKKKTTYRDLISVTNTAHHFST